MSQSSASCRRKIAGICVVTCEDGQLVEHWVNLNAVHALSWCSDSVDGKPGGHPGSPPSKKLPTGKKPTKCPPANTPVPMDPDPPVCWWTGSNWECGEE